MPSLIRADIFFFVTTIMVVIVGIAFTVALIYLTIVLRRVRDVMTEVKEEAVLIRTDIQNFREQVKQGGSKLKYLAEIMSGIFKIKSRNAKNK